MLTAPYQFDELLQDVRDGLDGKVPSIPIKGFPKLSRNLTIRKSTFALIGSNAGAGKSAFADSFYILNPLEWYLENLGNTDIEIEWLVWSMERPFKEKVAKWICNRLHRKYQIMIDTDIFFSYNVSRNKMSQEIYDKIVECREYYDKIFEHVTLMGADNPTGIYKYCKERIKASGNIVQVDQYRTKFVPNNPKKIFIILVDHLQCLRSEQNFTDKQLIDKMNEYFRELRDYYGACIVAVSQFNRDLLNDSLRRKQTDLSPQESDFKDSSESYESADIVIALFNPFKYQEFKHLGYDINAFTTSDKANRFRSLFLLKNSYGIDNIAYGNLFFGESAVFQELPSPTEQKELLAWHNFVKNVKRY